MNLSSKLRQDATYWAPTGSTNDYGAQEFAAPILLKCRWEDFNELFISKEGKEETSRAKVMFQEVIDLQGFIYLGDAATSPVADPRDVPGATEVRGVKRIPDLRSLQNLTTVWL